MPLPLRSSARIRGEPASNNDDNDKEQKEEGNKNTRGGGGGGGGGGGVDESQNTITENLTLEQEINATVAAAALSITSPNGSSTNHGRLQGGEGDENAPTHGRGLRKKKHTSVMNSFIESSKKAMKRRPFTPRSSQQTTTQYTIPPNPSMSIDHITPKKGGTYSKKKKGLASSLSNGIDGGNGGGDGIETATTTTTNIPYGATTTVVRDTEKEKGSAFSLLNGVSGGSDEKITSLSPKSLFSSVDGAGDGKVTKSLPGAAAAAKKDEEAKAAARKAKKDEEAKAAAAASAASKKDQEAQAAAKKDEEAKAAAAASAASKKDQEAQAAARKAKKDEEAKAAAAASAASKKDQEAQTAARKAKKDEEAKAAAAASKKDQEDQAAAKTAAAKLQAETKNKEEERQRLEQVDEEHDSEVKVTKEIQGNNKLKCGSMNSFILPDVVEGIDTLFLSEINDNMDCDAMKFKGDMSTKLDSVPIRDILIDREDRLVLSRNPDEDINKTIRLRLYCTGAALDLYIWWINDASSDVIILPSCSYDFMKKLGREDYADSGIEKYLKRTLTIDPENLIKKKAILIPVFGENHYSFTSIFYPSNVADESGKYVNNVPCIVCANSIPNYGSSHKTKEVAKVLRRFLNKLIKYHDPKSTGNFNKRTMLAYTLEVPNQKFEWDCCYQVMLMFNSIVAFLKKSPYGVTTKVLQDLDAFSKDNFSYNPLDGGTTLRASLYYLSKCLAYIHRRHYQNGKNWNNNCGNTIHVDDLASLKTTTIDKFFRDGNTDTGDDYDDDGYDWKPSVPIKFTKKMRTELNLDKKVLVSDIKNEDRADVLKKRKREQDAKSARRVFNGRGFRGVNPHSKKEVKKARRNNSNKRLKGQHAASIRSYKDGPYRMRLFAVIKEFNLFRHMSRFKSKKTNEKTKRVESIMIIRDPISLYPDIEGEDFDQERDEPYYLVVADDAATARQLFQDVYDNWDKIKFITDQYKIDEEIFGSSRTHIDDVISGKEDKVYQDDIKNKAMSKEDGTKISTPKPTSESYGNFEDRNALLSA